MSKRPQLNSLLRVLAGRAAAFAVQAQAAEEVSLYTTREPKLIQPLLDAFTKESGIKVNTVFVKDGLLERQGRRRQVAGRRADDRGHRQPAGPGRRRRDPAGQVRNAGIRHPRQPARRRRQWYALSLRDRVLYVEKT